MKTIVGVDVCVDLFNNSLDLCRVIKILKNRYKIAFFRLSGKKIDYFEEATNNFPNLEFLIVPRAIDCSFNQHKTMLREIVNSKILFKNTIISLGNELSLDTKIAIRKEKYIDRVSILWKSDRKKLVSKIIQKGIKELLKFFKNKNIRLTYCSGPWEKINWNDLDYVGINRYVTPLNQSMAKKNIDEAKKFGKPIIVTEMGCSAYDGANYYGSSAYMCYHKDFRRNDVIQAKAVIEQLEFMKKESISRAIVFSLYEDVPSKANTYSITKSLKPLKPRISLVELSKWISGKKHISFSKKEKIKNEKIRVKVENFRKKFQTDKEIYSVMMDTQSLKIIAVVNNVEKTNVLLRRKAGSLITYETYENFKGRKWNRAVCLYGVPV